MAYVHEPFNVAIRINVGGQRFQNWYQYISDDESGEYERLISDILEFKYPLSSNLHEVRSLRNAAKLVRDQLRFGLYGLQGRRALLKDPIAIFSAGWLHRTFDMDVLVMIRHPAAFCSSILIKQWSFDFNNFVRQPELMDRYLYPFSDAIREYSRNTKPLIDQAVLLWNCFHYTIDQYLTEYPEWTFIRHEDVSLEPNKIFRKIYSRMGLVYSDRTRRYIEKTSSSRNPTEQSIRNEFRRNSAANIYNWKNRLSLSEIGVIRARTENIAGRFYDSSAW